MTTEDDPVKLAAVWDAIRANKSGDAARMLAQVPSTRRGTGYWIATGHLHFRLRNLGKAQAHSAKRLQTIPTTRKAYFGWPWLSVLIIPNGLGILRGICARE